MCGCGVCGGQTDVTPHTHARTHRHTHPHRALCCPARWLTGRLDLTPCCMLPCYVSLPRTGAPRGRSHQAAPRWSAGVWLVLFPMMFTGRFLPVAFVTVFLIWSGGTVLINSVQARFVFCTFILLAWRQQWLVGTFRTEHGHFGLRGTALNVCVYVCVSPCVLERWPLPDFLFTRVDPELRDRCGLRAV